MKRKNKLRPVPDFKSQKEEADFWSTHDTTEYNFDETDETITLSTVLKAKIQDRRRERLKVMLALDEKKVEKLKKIAQQKKVDQFSLIRRWIDEGIKREAV